ncbi:MAG TPA: acyltransferase [Telluria sp.]|nr:acyltransferase [Telluria sp.]
MSKSHYEVLDGLRGTAAFSVLVFHIWELIVPGPEQNPMGHTFLAVDFFFALSGFVLGHAYDDRLGPQAAPAQRMGSMDFVKRRLIRLHPMVLMAMLIGLVVYLCDPYASAGQGIGPKLSLGMLVLTFGLSLLLLPTPTLPDYFGETHSVNGPSWTLFQEYIANAWYARFGARLGRRSHLALIALAAAALLWTGHHFGNLGFGWGWGHAWVAPVRLACPFLLGLLVYRSGRRITLPQPFVLLSLALVAVFMSPFLGTLNWLYEAACVIVLFPLVLMAGAGTARARGWTGGLCRLAGELSYPVYIIHYPFLYVFAHWNWSTHPSQPVLAATACAIVGGVTLLAFLLSRYYDRPLRAWLARTCLEPASARAPAGSITT